MQNCLLLRTQAPVNCVVTDNYVYTFVFCPHVNVATIKFNFVQWIIIVIIIKIINYNWSNVVNKRRCSCRWCITNCIISRVHVSHTLATAVLFRFWFWFRGGSKNISYRLPHCFDVIRRSSSTAINLGKVFELQAARLCVCVLWCVRCACSKYADMKLKKKIKCELRTPNTVQHSHILSES